MSDEKPKSHVISNTAASGVGALAGALGTASFITNKLAPLNNLMAELVGLVHAGKSTEALTRLIESHRINADDANLIIEAIEHTADLEKTPSTQATKAMNNFYARMADEKLSGIAKTFHKHPRTVIAGGALTGGAVALGTLSALRGSEKPLASPNFTQREDTRRVDAANLPPETTR